MVVTLEIQMELCLDQDPAELTAWARELEADVMEVAESKGATCLSLDMPFLDWYEVDDDEIDEVDIE